MTALAPEPSDNVPVGLIVTPPVGLRAIKPVELRVMPPVPDCSVVDDAPVVPPMVDVNTLVEALPRAKVAKPVLPTFTAVAEDPPKFTVGESTVTTDEAP